MLNIFQPKMQLAACNKCHKLHNVKNIVEYKKEGKAAIANCLHEEFPNNPVSSRRKMEQLLYPVCMLYPKPSIRQQLSILYQRPGFENMLKLSGVQREEDNIYSDIYDGKIWKTFPFDGSTFFTPETATTNLGLLFNLDWFQPFTYTQHSTGAIYASICNLPRSERNKPENIIYLGFLPGPKEYSDGLDIKVALIVGSSDISATRKLFGHGSAVMKCHRCEKHSIYSEKYRKTHYGGDHNYEIITTESHRKYAYEWLQCNSKNSREDHFKEHGVRWSELLHLPYMDPIRFAAVDPMHCLFLGVAKWIIKSIFVNQGKLSMEQLRVAQNRMDHVELPSDIGRIPPKIAIGNDGFSNLTADQWKTFIMIYSTTVLWDMLDNDDRKILGYFVRACNLLVTRIITEDDLTEAQERLKDMSHLIENTYGPEFITSNIHLALHIADCCRDYGPVYSFWLFPFERLNGFIGSYPNSNRQIEPELMKIVLKNTLIDYYLTCKWLSGLLDESLCLLTPKKYVGSLALTAEREELQHFLSMRYNTSTLSKIYGTEEIPGQFLKPSYLRVVMPSELRMFLCEWYATLYEKDQEDILGFMDLQINQYARLKIGAEIFGSMISGRHEKNATILAKWKAFNDESIDIYPGEVQYYFEHTLNLPDGPRTHLLAYVKWYKNAPSSDIRFKHRFMEPEISNTELWKTEYYEEALCTAEFCESATKEWNKLKERIKRKIDDIIRGYLAKRRCTVDPAPEISVSASSSSVGRGSWSLTYRNTDGHYCLASVKSARQFATVFADNAVIISQDDKAKIGLGVLALIPSVYLMIKPNELNDELQTGQLAIFVRRQLVPWYVLTLTLESLTLDPKYNDVLKTNGEIRHIWVLLVMEVRTKIQDI
ncbi:hypothetical protein RhiirA4_476956 [Rhizophagus irregularis]|uniref:Uncharacterized protein n=1 Tax=Rhizophagus irregularis TaxID=588596 RepID=A0A2I1HCJ1_9GLOM|nr:hypothetical protein RhiirA4_476956 [Rhizophagus irregularis]